MGSASQDAELITKSTNVGPDTRKESKTKFPPTTGPLRRLIITAKSTKLSRLDLMMRSLRFNTLVKDMEGYRSKVHSVDWLIEMTARDGDINPKNATRIQKLGFLAEGSPTLRYTMHQLRDWVVQGDATSIPPRKIAHN